MTYPFPPEVRELIDSRMATGSYASEDELLKEALQTLPAEDDLAAIREGLDLLIQGYHWRTCGAEKERIFQ